MSQGLKAWAERWQELSKRLRKWAAQLQNSAAGPDPLVQQMRAMLKQASPQSPLGKLLGEVCDMHERLTAARQTLGEECVRLLCDPAEMYVAKVVAPARAEASRVRQLQKLVDEKGLRLRTLCERAQTDKQWAAQVMEGSRALWDARARLRTGMRRAHARLSAAFGAVEAASVEWVAAWMGAKAQHLQQLVRSEGKWRAAQQEALRCYEEWKLAAVEEASQLLDRHQSSRVEGDLEKLQRFVTVLGAEDLMVVSAVVTSADAEREEVLSALVQVLDSFHRALPIIHLGIVQEVKTTSKASTLFRGNSMSTKMMSAFTKHTGIPYLRATLGPLVRDVLQRDPALFEVDPKYSPSDVAANMERLEQLCITFLDTLIASVDLMPVPFRWMARVMHDEVAARFPDSKKQSVGGFLFLRFICPAMLSPEHHGLAEDGSQLTPEKRRPLTLVSKVLQNLSNEVSFGTKEAFLEPLNKLLADNAARLAAFFEHVIDIPETRPELVQYEPLVGVAECKARRIRDPFCCF